MAMKRTIDFHLNDQRKKANLYRAIKNDLDNDDSSSEEEATDQSTTLYPLSHYANDPEQLIQQLFSVVRGKRLARLLPPELKDIPFEELKTDCLIQLLCMSKKRVLATLEGKEMNSSSDSDDSIDNQRKQVLKTEHKEKIIIKRSLKEKKRKSSKKKKIEAESEPKYEKSEEKAGKTLLEILELEMKAKAIRALLGPDKKDTDTQIEEAIKNEIVSEQTDKKNNENQNGNEQYEERKDVKEVVRTSRLCTNMRRRMLLHQQKMLADRAKLKAEEAKNIQTNDTLYSKMEHKSESVDSIHVGEQSNVLEKKTNNTSAKGSNNNVTSENEDSHIVKQVKNKNRLMMIPKKVQILSVF